MQKRATKLHSFPVFMRVEDRHVVIVGGGDEALAKARLLSQSSARLSVVAAHAEPALTEWLAANEAAHIAEPYRAAHMADATLVFAASGDAELDARVSADARLRSIPVNAVDRPELCDFFTPALVNRAPVAVAIGTDGAGPVLAQMIRAAVDRMLHPSLGALASLAAAYRGAVERLLPRGDARRRFWSAFFSGTPARAVEIGSFAEAREAADELLRRRGARAGHVALVGAGPGAADLLTLRAHRLLMEADVIVHDALVPESVIAMGRRDAERIAAGKRLLPQLLLQFAGCKRHPCLFTLIRRERTLRGWGKRRSTTTDGMVDPGNLQSRWAPCAQTHGPGQGQLPRDQ